MTIRTLLTAAVLSLSTCVAPVMASVEYHDKINVAVISGPSDYKQESEVRELFSKEQVRTVYLSGPGGYMSVGMSLGRMLRDEGSEVIVPENSICVSACAIAAMGAHELRLDGPLWFHRPYVRGVPVYADIEEIMGQGIHMSAIVSEYFAEMNYSMKLWTQIARRTNPCKFLVIKDGYNMSYMKQGPMSKALGYYNMANKCAGTPFE